VRCEAVNADHRGEVASLRSLAAALDEYEHAPHDGVTVRRRRGPREAFQETPRMRDNCPKVKDSLT
jgi:hypothetical protein